MSLIAIQMCPEYGFTAATFALARRLQSRGHRVVYLCDKAMAGQVAANGFDVHVIPAPPRMPAADVKHVPARGALVAAARIVRHLSESAGAPAGVRERLKRFERRIRTVVLRVQQHRA